MFSKSKLNRGYVPAGLNNIFLNINVSRDASDNPEYIGYSYPGAGANSPSWLIIKYYYTGLNLDKSRVAGGSLNFDKVWSDKASYNYS